MHKSIFGLDEVSFHDEGQAYLCTTYDPSELQMILGLLNSAEIPFLVKDRGAGGVSRIIMGFSLYGTDIFVPEAALEKATALILPSYDLSENTEASEEDGTPNDDDL